MPYSFNSELSQPSTTKMTIKELVNIRFEAIPLFPEIYKSSISSLDVVDLDKFIVVNATVIRVANRKSSEKSKLFQCMNCQHVIKCYADHVNMNKIDVPPKCPNIVVKQKKGNPFWDMLNKMKGKNKGDGGNVHAKTSASKSYESQCGCTKLEAVPDSQQFVDYQEIKIQESFRTIKPGNIPRTIWVILEVND